VSYNSVLCCAATGVENNDGGGFERIHGDHAVRLHGRTYHFLPTSSGNAGLNFFTFDNLANCTDYATKTLNDAARGYQRIIPTFLENIFNELKRYNVICQECEQIGYYARDYMNSNSTQDAFATINEATSYLDVAQITSDTVTGNRIITFHRKGDLIASSLQCTDKMWEPFVYPLLFFHAERGWGADIRQTIKYTDYLVARLLCPEKIVDGGEERILRVPNQSLDSFIRPIIKQQLGDESSTNDVDIAYHYYSKVFGASLQSSKNYNECIRELLKVYCNELKNVTHIPGFDQFCTNLHLKLHNKSMKTVKLYIQCYIESRRLNGDTEEEIEGSLKEVSNYHMTEELEKGRMMLVPTNRFQLMSRLSQTYLVDSISRAIDYRLRFHKFHQKDLFGIDNENEINNVEDSGIPEERTFLSQSMHGSRRHLRSLAKNALALVSEYGRPSLFITLTCNPYWPEIVEQLLPSQTAFDRGDIVCQVFYRKLETLLKNIRNGKYFKIKNMPNLYHKIKFEVRVIEYQRRGLPHVHLVIKFEENNYTPRYEDKAGLSEWIDYHITAAYPTTELDDEQLEANETFEKDLVYAKIVKSHMIHKCFPECNGGCKNDKNICSKGYDSNILTNTTKFDDKGFPQYKRPTIKSLYVVPHHRELLKDWNGHANVEYAGSTYTVIYLYKYLFKGSKKVKLRLTNADDVNDKDEIKLYLRGRYLCSMDCYWRILGHETYPAPTPSVRIVKVISEQRSIKTLTDGKIPDIIIYFNRPAILHHMKYTEFFNSYMWSYNRPTRFQEQQPGYYIIILQNINKNVYLYKRSESNTSITRLEVIAITAGEPFFLRLILYNYPKISYKDCLTTNERIYPTYQEAAVAAGIVKDNEEVYACFEEAEHFQDMTPSELRTLFVISTLQGFPTLKILSEDRFKHMMYDDFLHNYNPLNHKAAWNDLLCEISRRFESEGKDMTDYGLPQPAQMKTELEIERQKYNAQDQLLIYNNLCETVPNTNEQQEILNDIVHAVEHQQTKIYYVQGQAGSGKSTLAKKIMAYCRSINKLCAGCASTGLAATLYEGFETAHSLFKFPVVEEDEREVDVPVECQLSKSPNRMEYLKAVDVILWDEFPSCDREVFEAAYRALNKFNKKIVITMGDMRQIAPVVVNGDKVDVLNHSITSSPLWRNFSIKKLTKNMRLLHLQTNNSSRMEYMENQRQYGEMLLDIGNGTKRAVNLESNDTSQKTTEGTTIELQGCLRIADKKEAINFVFTAPLNPDLVSKMAILAGTNEEVDEWNQEVQKLNAYPLITLASHDELAESDDPHNILRSMLTDDVLNSYNKNGVPPHTLKLKINDTCIVLRNLNKKEGLTNNTRVRIIAITTKCVRVQTITEQKKSFSIPRIRFKFRLPFGRSFELLRTQFPLRLAYCISINKSQGNIVLFQSCKLSNMRIIGQELSKCLLDLRTPPFAHGHLYVALSRIRKYTDIAVYTNDENIINGVVTTENVVYPELLKDLIN